MSRMPAITARQLIKALFKAGFLEQKQHGSHLRLYHPGKNLQTTVPIHPGDLPRGLVKAIIKQAGMTEEEILQSL